MKKLLAATVLLSTLALPAQEVDAKTNLCEAPTKYYSSTAVDNEKDLKAIYNGTYSVKGIKLNQSFKYIKSKLGNMDALITIKDKEGTQVTADYGDYELLFKSPKRYTSIDNLKLYAIDITLPDKSRMLRGDLIKILGEPSAVMPHELFDRTETFNYLHANFSEISNEWLAESITMYHPKLDRLSPVYHKDNFKVNKLKSVSERALTTSQLTAMKKGTFSYNGIRPGMTPASVYKAVGQSNSEEYSRDEEGMFLDQYYGIHDWISLSYDAENCDGKYKVYDITFSFEGKKHSESQIRKILGKPASVSSEAYVDDETGKQVYEKYLEYDNVYLTLEKSGKTYYVSELSYQK